jgi:GTP-binding protein EngB required for normal cell division
MFNGSQASYVVGRLRHVEELLTRAVDELDPAKGSPLFHRTTYDASPTQRRLLQDYLEQLRFVIQRFMQAQSLQDSSAPISGLWSFQTALSFALIAIEEMRPQYLRGYGTLDEEASIVAQRFVADAQTLLKRVSSYLATGTGGDLAARIEQLDSTRDEFALLAELERVVKAHGLVEFRSTLEELTERAVAPRLEIAVFGRVSAGKSSLLNWWLGGSVLPTGITPVTAVPTRIAQGEPRINVTFAAGQHTEGTLKELASFISEADNPSNRQGVLEVAVYTQAERLRDGVVLVDTPGVGSLARAGAIQTLQYLPRCDLGILLIEAGTPMTLEDVAIARSLLDGGSDALIVLSKADRLSAQELSAALEYAKQELSARLTVMPSVVPISTHPDCSTLASEWFRDNVEPRLDRYREEAAQTLRRKIGALRGSVIAVLEARLTRGHPSLSREGLKQPVQGDQIAEGRAAIDAMKRDLSLLGGEVREHVGAVLKVGAEDLARAWQERQDLHGASSRAQAAMERRLEQIGENVMQSLSELRAKLEAVIQMQGEQVRSEDLPLPRGLPLVEMPWPANARAFGRPLILTHSAKKAAKRLRQQVGASLAQQLIVYGEALRLWALRYLDELSATYNAAIARYEGLERMTLRPSSPDSETPSMSDDLCRLSTWSGTAPQKGDIQSDPA